MQVPAGGEGAREHPGHAGKLRLLIQMAGLSGVARKPAAVSQREKSYLHMKAQLWGYLGGSVS